MSAPYAATEPRSVIRRLITEIETAITVSASELSFASDEVSDYLAKLGHAPRKCECKVSRLGYEDSIDRNVVLHLRPELLPQTGEALNVFVDPCKKFSDVVDCRVFECHVSPSTVGSAAVTVDASTATVGDAAGTHSSPSGVSADPSSDDAK